MELKGYQQAALDQVKRYLELLAKERVDNNAKHASLDAWQAMEIKKGYQERQNGLEHDLPNFCLKIPTGGGKTFLAVKTIDLINTVYRRKRTGLFLWVVPTTQIYNQTLNSLKDRAHPYRQHLDIASGGRTLILEKGDRFSPLDIEESLAVFLLMLPSANRKTKETLKLFQDNGGFQSFFPAEDAFEDQQKLFKAIPNLDIYGGKESLWQMQIKTSLGNVLRLLSPMIILDEGHKAYSEGAQETLRGLNPAMIVELSATPTEESNVLVDIRGIDLHKEDMIKLDLHITNKASTDWKDTLVASVDWRNSLEKKAREYEASTGINIRPINLIQVERTGKDQRGSGRIHAEDVREYLIKVLGIPEAQIAVKTSEKDELKEVDDIGGLMSREVPIRYIITKQALQEGWDCAFAYVLTILANPQSKNALTQLVGRILRQPNARKTGVKELDESYVFCFQQKGKILLDEIRKGFGQEGLGDLTSRIVADDGLDDAGKEVGERIYMVRERFKKAAEQVVLPVFVIQDGRGWRKVNYQMDVLAQVPWESVDATPLYDLVLSKEERSDKEHIAGLAEDVKELISVKEVKQLREGGLEVDPVFIARHLLDTVPNPWVAYEFGEKLINGLQKKYGEELVANNFVFIVEELRTYLIKERDRLSEEVFRKLVAGGMVRFMVISKDDIGFRLPKKVTIKKISKPLLQRDGISLQRSLFEFIPEEAVDELEKEVVWYLEEKDRLFFWYRNAARNDYGIQGWRKHKIYPDFIFTTDGAKAKDFEKVFIVETKGLHLKNEDTAYKQSVFDLCNEQAKEKGWGELALAMKGKPVRFEVVFGDEWEKKLNMLLEK